MDTVKKGFLHLKPWLVLAFIIITQLSHELLAQDLSDFDVSAEELKVLLEEIPMEEDVQKDPAPVNIKKTTVTKTTTTKTIKADSALNNELLELEKIDGFSKTASPATHKSDKKYLNDLEEFKNDFGNLDFGEIVIPEPDDIHIATPSDDKQEAKEKSSLSQNHTKTKTSGSAAKIFNVGREERELLEISKYVKPSVSKTDWESLLTATNRQTYIVQKNDWLFKISKKLFGSGFYYPKIWAINDYITNPHEIEPGMVLVFDTGDMSSLPAVRLGTFSKETATGEVLPQGFTSFDSFGEGARPPWLEEKEKLKASGTYFQYATESTIDDLKRLSEQSLITEYKNYSPPHLEIDQELPATYDETGFDKTSKLDINYKEGFFLNTFISNNPVKDFGEIDSAIHEGVMLRTAETIYLKLDNINPIPGDEFSIYRYDGKVSHKKSERQGRKYTIVAQVKIIAKRDKNLWEAEIVDTVETVQRGDRVTSFTPKIDKIVKKFSPRKIEGVIMATYHNDQVLPGFGDVVYIDRGRADGVELGDIFEVWGFKDRLTEQNITYDPTYKNGEVTIISLTDNFATALISNARRDFRVGDVAITKSKSSALMAERMRLAKHGQAVANLDRKDNLDVELKLEDLNKDMLKGAERIEFSEDELAELEKLEKEKSIIKTSNDELSDLERLEKQLELAEKELSEGKRDQDQLLESQNLDDLEQNQQFAFGDDLDIIEENFGKKYLDEELNKNDNPHGLTEFDIEEVDELLNLDKNPDNDKEAERL